MQLVLNRIYGLPASVTIIAGKWKDGKTDFALLLTELTRQLHLISQFASNIETQDSDVQFINSFTQLDYWHFSSSNRKMFLYDETVESSPKRGAMTALNVGWVRRIPQLSKARCHLVAICQEETLADSIFLNPTFCRGLWRKLNRKTVLFHSHLFSETLCWKNIPKTNINFDPYLVATFKMSELKLKMLPRPFEVLKRYGDGQTLDIIKVDMGYNQRTEAMRDLRRACKSLSVTLLQLLTEGNKLPELSNNTDQ